MILAQSSILLPLAWGVLFMALVIRFLWRRGSRRD